MVLIYLKSIISIVMDKQLYNNNNNAVAEFLYSF